MLRVPSKSLNSSLIGLLPGVFVSKCGKFTCCCFSIAPRIPPGRSNAHVACCVLVLGGSSGRSSSGVICAPCGAIWKKPNFRTSFFCWSWGLFVVPVGVFWLSYVVLGGSLGDPWASLGGPWGVPGGVLRDPWGILGDAWEVLGGFVRLPGRSLGDPWVSLGAFKNIENRTKPKAETRTVENPSPKQGTVENRRPKQGTVENPGPKQETVENRRPKQGTVENRRPKQETVTCEACVPFHMPRPRGRF